ncbi:TRIM2_3 [Mytilus coruscus]|uniref:TRIM2_3 n=1 Tax=Mytilus coruscus TaxID=42192 RepID=A0A6J8B2P9_MYTCO|nr:TRIM2_3 [Mytilus coruscus]
MSHTFSDRNKFRKTDEERVIKNVKEDYLICSICIDQFVDPRVLPCGHSFCLTCLTEYIDKSANEEEFACPIDRQNIQKPFGMKDSKRWAQYYPPATFLRTLVKAVEIHEGTVPTCRRHHGRPREFYCATDDVLVCSECAVNEHRSENCDCTTLNDIYNRRKDDIQMLHSALNGQESCVHQLITDQYRLRELFLESKSSVKCELDMVRDRLSVFYESTSRALDELSEEIDQSEFTRYNLEAQLDSFSKDISEMKDELKDLKPSIDFMDILQRIESKVDYYGSELEDISSFLKECEKSECARIQFVPNTSFMGILDEYSVGSIVNHSDN